jgi:O-antigen ligase/tetratricopeptide (TPR) repeat protein
MHRPHGLLQTASLLGQLLVLVMIAVTPWFFGGVHPFVQVWMFVGMAGVVVCCTIDQVAAIRKQVQIPLAVLPLLGGLVLGTLQLVPLSPRLLEIVSPTAVNLRKTLVDESEQGQRVSITPSGPVDRDRQQPISLYPASTRHDLAMLVLATGAFLVGAILFQTSAAQVWLCGVLAVNGAILSFFGLVQALSWNGQLYWHFPLTSGGAPFGPFVCRNNAAGFLSLCLAGAVGLVIQTFHQPTRSAENADQMRLFGEHSSRLAACCQSLHQTFARLDGANTAALALGGCIVAGIVCALSRGGWLAMAGATVGTGITVWMIRRRMNWLWPFVPIAILGLGLVVWCGLDDQVQGRLATFSEWNTLSRNRLPHWRDSLKAVPDFWLTGSGLGTYRYLYKLYDTTYSGLLFYHAENQYLEAIVEGGVLGLALVLAAIVLVMRAACRLLHKPSTRWTFAFGIAGAFAVLTQVIHSLFDFGLYLPANMFTFAVICGALCGHRPIQVGESVATSSELCVSANGRRMAGRFAAFAMLLAGLIWGGVQIQRFATRESALAYHAIPNPEKAAESDTKLDSALTRIERAILVCEDDAELHLAAAKLRIGQYRMAALKVLQDSVFRKAGLDILWDMTSTDRIRAKAHQLAGSGLDVELQALRQHPLVCQYLIPAVEHLLRARGACPLLPEVHLSIAELACLVEPSENETIHIRRACQLAPGNAGLWFAAGLFELHAGRRASAWQIWRESLAANTQHLEKVLILAQQEASKTEIAQDLLPDSVPLLIQVGRQEYAAAEHAAGRVVLSRRIESLLPTAKLDRAEKHYYRGLALAMRNDRSGAIESLTLATELRPAQADWHYELAVQLFDDGRLAEAHRECKLAAQVEPGSQAYRQLLKKINRARLIASLPDSGEANPVGDRSPKLGE